MGYISRDCRGSMKEVNTLLEFLKEDIKKVRKDSIYYYEEGITPKNVWYELENIVDRLSQVQKIVSN